MVLDERRWSSSGPVAAADPGADARSPAMRSHPVAGARRRGRQQEGGIHGRVEARPVPDPAGAGARGVEDDDDPPVLLGLPGAHDDVLSPGGGAPVDASGRRRPRRSRGGSRTPCPGPGSAPPPARRSWRRAASRLGRCLRAGNGCSARSEPATSKDRCRAASPRGPSVRTVTRSAEPVAAAGGRERRRRADPLARRDPEGCRSPAAPAEGWPRVAQAARGPLGRRGCVTRRAERVLSPSRTWVGALRARWRRLGDGARRRSTATRRTIASSTTAGPCRRLRPDEDRHQPEQGQHDGARGEGHQRGTGTDPSALSRTELTLTPSSSASGRSESRWARVAWARALTSSGVT